MSGYSGFYRAVVVTNHDPQELRRVKLRIPALFGQAVTNWATPMFRSSLPVPGEVVWAAFEGGDKNRPLFIGRLPSGTGGGGY